MEPEPALDGQVAVVTGASQRIGAAVSRTLSSAGASVVLTARSKDDLDDRSAIAYGDVWAAYDAFTADERAGMLCDPAARTYDIVLPGRS